MSEVVVVTGDASEGPQPSCDLETHGLLFDANTRLAGEVKRSHPSFLALRHHHHGRRETSARSTDPSRLHFMVI